MDHEYDLEDDYAPRVLWGRIAFFLLAVLLAFLAGRCTKDEGVPQADLIAEQEKVRELSSENTVLQQQLDAATNTPPDDGQGGGKKDKSEEPTEPSQDEVGKGRTYIVQENDTLYGIAIKEYGDASKVDLIMDANNLTKDTPLRVGQELIIPDDGE